MTRPIFVEVDDDLVRLIRSEAKGRAVIDCGAGMGLLGSKMPEVVSIDIQPPDEPLSPVAPIDARKWVFNEQHMPVFLRPDHSGWVDEVLQGDTAVFRTALYIGFRMNLRRDLLSGGFAYHVVGPLDGWEGKNGERVYRIMVAVSPPKKEEFLLIHDPYQGSWWVREVNGRYQNMSGGFSPHGYEVVKKAMAYGLDQLDWNGTYLTPEKSSAGWLDRGGKFHPCPSQCHDIHAELVLRQTVDDLGRLGWARVYSDSPGDWAPGDLRLSPEQARWLDRNDYDIKEEYLP